MTGTIREWAVLVLLVVLWAGCTYIGTRCKKWQIALGWFVINSFVAAAFFSLIRVGLR